jgi:hypothetical protein
MSGYEYAYAQLTAERGQSLRAEAEVHRVTGWERRRPALVLRLARRIALRTTNGIAPPPIAAAATNPAA